MIQIKDDDKSSPELQALVENEIKQLLKVKKKISLLNFLSTQLFF